MKVSHKVGTDEFKTWTVRGTHRWMKNGKLVGRDKLADVIPQDIQDVMMTKFNKLEKVTEEVAKEAPSNKSTEGSTEGNTEGNTEGKVQSKEAAAREELEGAGVGLIPRGIPSKSQYNANFKGHKVAGTLESILAVYKQRKLI